MLPADAATDTMGSKGTEGAPNVVIILLDDMGSSPIPFGPGEYAYPAGPTTA